MFVRSKVEVDYADIYEKYGYATTTWSPLAMGLLTGRYLSGEKEEGRWANNHTPKDFVGAAKHFAPENLESTKKKFKQIEDIGKELGGASIA